MTDETPSHRKAELPAVKCETTYTDAAPVDYSEPEEIETDEDE